MISHPHKCIFVHIPKCGGQSVETAFLHDLGLDWRTRMPLLLRRNDVPALGPPRLAHLTAAQYVKHHYISKELFNQYFTFGIIRNPWRRTLSYYHYLGYLVSFKKFVCDILPKKLWKSHYWFVAPQSHYIKNKDGTIAVKRIYRIEYLDDCFCEIQERSGLKAELAHVNPSQRDLDSPPVGHRLWLLRKTMQGEKWDNPRSVRAGSVLATLFGKQESFADWRDYFDEETKESVAALYRDDIRAFDFTFE